MSIQMPYQPDETEQAVLDVLRKEGRANPMRIREQTDIRKQYINDALRQLQKAELVEQVTRGLYAYAGDETVGGVDLDELRDAVVDAREAFDDVNGEGVDEALSRLEELLYMEDGDGDD